MLLDAATTLLLLLRVPLLLVGALLLLAYIWEIRVRKTYDYGKFLRLPGPTPIPLLGNIHLFFGKSPSEAMLIFNDLHEEYGPVLRLSLGPFPRVSLTGANGMKALLSDARWYNNKGTQIYPLFEDWLGKGLVTNNGESWQQRRKFLTPAFHFQILKDFLPIINKQVNILVNDIMPKEVDRNRPADISELVTRMTLDVICEAAMGQDLQVQENPDTEYTKGVYSVARILGERADKPEQWNDTLFSWSANYKKFKESLKVIHEFTDALIRKRREDLEDEDLMQGKGSRLAFLDLLLKAADSNQLSVKDIRDEVHTLAFAGHDTTSTSIMYTLYTLAAHPACLKKVQDELRDIFGNDSDRDVTTDDIANMKYLSCCIKETMRLYSTIPAISRTSDVDLVFDDIVIPANIEIAPYFFLHHRDPNWFPNPKKFDPERFGPEAPQRHAFAYVPFSAGARNCIGQKFAEMEQRVALATILRNYDLRTDLSAEELDASLVTALTLRNDTGLPIYFKPRNND